MRIIGERINTSRKTMFEKVSAKDAEFLIHEVKRQRDAGAEYIDVNTATLMEREIEYLTWAIETIQGAIDAPISIDSPNAKAIEAVIPKVKGKAMINSITMEPRSYDHLIPLIQQYQPDMVALCMGADKMPETVDDTLRFAEQIMRKLTGDGVKPDQVYLDPMIFPVSTNHRAVLRVLEVTPKLKAAFPEAHTVCGLSNVSFGLPLRKLINQTFMTMVVAAGFDAAIIDPCDERLMANFYAARLLAGQDEFCAGYLKAYRKGKIT